MHVSKRELEILNFISTGLSNKQIAEQLQISYNTVHTHRRRLLLKLNAKNSANLIRIAYENNLLPRIE